MSHNLSIVFLPGMASLVGLPEIGNIELGIAVQQAYDLVPHRTGGPTVSVTRENFEGDSLLPVIRIEVVGRARRPAA